ncbi:MAG: alpha/beta fold hydrolase [Myxococcaceae bacterium]|jgi:pimeloyl-ACP methyl ester carboxylesterase|nr:alpha/beta fold hydrolase [Myxococcaceae bacterium]
MTSWRPGRIAVQVGLGALLAACASGCLAHHTGAMPGEPADGTFVSVEGVRVRYLDVGEGPAVVLLHGFASSIENWVAVIPALKGKHRVLAVDLKGFGWTDRPVGDYSPAAQAALVRAVMKERGVDKAAVVAHSWGSSVALAFALAYPEATERLALYDAWVYESQLPSMFQLARAKGLGEFLFAAFYSERGDERLANAFYDPEIIPEKLVEDVERAMERPGTRAAALEAVRGMRFFEVEGRYSSIKAPTLLLWGREDIVTPLSVGERLSRELPNARLVVYPRCGHFPMIEAIAASNRELVTFLGGAP